jgi:hypothetical protein
LRVPCLCIPLSNSAACASCIPCYSGIHDHTPRRHILYTCPLFLMSIYSLILASVSGRIGCFLSARKRVSYLTRDPFAIS